MELIDKIDASARESTEAGPSYFILGLDSLLLHWQKHEGSSSYIWHEIVLQASTRLRLAPK